MKKKFLFAIFLLGCGNDTLPKYVNLGGLRILALVGDTSAPSGAAEYSPGSTVRITPWISDFKGGTRTIQYEWQGCLDPGLALGVEPTCANDPAATSLVTANLTIPGTERTGSANTFDVLVPSTILDGRTALESQVGVNYLLIYRLKASDGTSVASFKRILVSALSKTTKNIHPTFSDILVGTTSLLTYPTGKVAMHSSYAAGARESYSVVLTTGSTVTLTEDLVTTWFITAGEVEAFRTVNDNAVTFDPGTGRPTDHTPLILAVMRDNRGGVAVNFKSGL